MRLRPMLIIVPLSVAALAAAVVNRVVIADYFRSAMQPELPPAVSFEDVTVQEAVRPQADKAPAAVPASEVKPAKSPLKPSMPEALTPLPTSFNLAVPFTSQAPLAIWDEVHEETCEEASLLMVDAFYDGRTSFDPDGADKELLAIVDFENKQFGYFEDTTAAETGVIARKFFGYETAEVVKAPTVEDIKREVRAGHPVIMPAAGRELHNPYFKQPGPLYHMIVIRGWTEEGFITNDPGTRRGEGYVYPFETIMDAMDDWDAEEGGLSGAKRVLVIEPNS
ncbi:hypothetical protein EPO34_01945 [Patescibacteria group bacterium]|nr:MAG: hypothetical protein EPO34_01945 [Patescibacteria group bacterium]